MKKFTGSTGISKYQIICCRIDVIHDMRRSSLPRLLSGGLTHWGRVTHICVSKLTIIGSDNGLSPGRRQAIIKTNAGILLIRPLETNFSEISIEILLFSFKKMRLKVSSAKRWPFCLDLNVLMVCVYSLTLDSDGYFNSNRKYRLLFCPTNHLRMEALRISDTYLNWWTRSSLGQVVVCCLVTKLYTYMYMIVVIPLKQS